MIPSDLPPGVLTKYDLGVLSWELICPSTAVWPNETQTAASFAVGGSGWAQCQWSNPDFYFYLILYFVFRNFSVDSTEGYTDCPFKLEWFLNIYPWEAMQGTGFTM